MTSIPLYWRDLTAEARARILTQMPEDYQASEDTFLGYARSGQGCNDIPDAGNLSRTKK